MAEQGLRVFATLVFACLFLGVQGEEDVSDIFSWSNAGAISGMDCVLVNEPNEPSEDNWHDNFFCSDPEKGYGFQYSYDGPIPGENQCVAITEPADPSWSNNYLCVDSTLPYYMTWSSSCPNPCLPNCVRFIEPSSSHTWGDNFLCFHGIVSVDIEYDYTNVEIGEAPEIAFATTWINDNSQISTQQFNWEYTTSRLESYYHTTGTEVTNEVGISVTAGGGFGVMEAETTIDYSYSATQTTEDTYGEEMSTDRTWSFQLTVNIPPHSEARTFATYTRIEGTIPFTGTITYSNGHTSTTGGSWVGVDYGNLVTVVETTTHPGCNDYGCTDAFCEWRDSNYDVCTSYEDNGDCYASWVPDRAVLGVDAEEACCACGGGIVGNQDPTCASGIQTAQSCCHASCVTCGGAGCANRNGGADACCGGNIMANDVWCASSLPPCIVPDTTCASGIQTDQACCLASCVTCGGVGCANRNGGADGCCEGNIMANDVSCISSVAPCIVPDPTCSTGIQTDDACCLASCGTCGGTGCGNFEGGADGCCGNNIMTAGVSCSSSVPPCVVTGGANDGSFNSAGAFPVKVSSDPFKGGGTSSGPVDFGKGGTASGFSDFVKEEATSVGFSDFVKEEAASSRFSDSVKEEAASFGGPVDFGTGETTSDGPFSFNGVRRSTVIGVASGVSMVAVLAVVFFFVRRRRRMYSVVESCDV